MKFIRFEFASLKGLYMEANHWLLQKS